jgi:hypothetical protein
LESRVNSGDTTEIRPPDIFSELAKPLESLEISSSASVFSIAFNVSTEPSKD